MGRLSRLYLKAKGWVENLYCVPVFIVFVAFCYLVAVGKYLFLGIRDYDFLQ